MSAQVEIFGVGAEARPPAANVPKRWGAEPRPAAEPLSSRQRAGLGFGDLFFLPRAQLEIGLRVVRWDDCRRCGAETSHVFTLIYTRPRTWARACLECRACL